MNGNLVRRRITATDSNTYMTTFASEIALIEADKEADKKYRELILEAENILVNMQKNQASLSVVPSPSRKLHNGLANKRVELIKNTELNIELALSRSRNSQPELQSGSIKDLEHTSPKRQQFVQQPCSPMRRFVERNASSPVATAAVTTFQSVGSTKCSVDSPLVSRRATAMAVITNQQQHSPDRSFLLRARSRAYENQDSDDYDGRRITRTVATANTPTVATSTTSINAPSAMAMFNCNGIILGSNANRCSTTRSQTSAYLVDESCATAISSRRDSLPGVNRKEFRGTRSSSNAVTKEETVTSSSSDSEERLDVGRRAPLMTFRLGVTIPPSASHSRVHQFRYYRQIGLLFSYLSQVGRHGSHKRRVLLLSAKRAGQKESVRRQRDLRQDTKNFRGARRFEKLGRGYHH